MSKTSKLFFIAVTQICFSLTALCFEYSVNLLWINKDINTDKNYVFPAVDRNNIRIISSISNWAEKNPQAVLNFWFDSQAVTDAQIQSTAELFYSFNKQFNRAEDKKIKLKDIRTLPEIANNQEVFSSKTPVYLRADLARLIASLGTLKECRNQNEDLEIDCYFVYADVDVTPVNKIELFDEKTLSLLKENGMVLHDGNNGLENSFHIISNHQPSMHKALQEAAININIERAKNFIKGSSWIRARGLAESVFASIYWVFSYFYHLENRAKLYSEGNEVDKNIDNTHIFKPEYQNAFGLEIIYPNGKPETPTKKMEAPDIQGRYY